jgi:hypothetical protein
MNEQARRYTQHRTSNSRSVAAGVNTRGRSSLSDERSYNSRARQEVVEKDEPDRARLGVDLGRKSLTRG